PQYEATVRGLLECFPEADKSCVNANRCWFSCQTIIHVCTTGKALTLAKEPPPEEELQDVPEQTECTERVEKHSRWFLRNTRPSLPGARGHDRLFRAACVLVPDYRLSDADALRLLSTVFNPRCKPRWSPQELRHKVAQAHKAERHVPLYGLD